MGMPIAISLGRRVVILVATFVLFLGAVLCATASSFESHLAARMLLGFAAGQSESVVPMIIQVNSWFRRIWNQRNGVGDPLPSRAIERVFHSANNSDCRQCGFGPLCKSYCCDTLSRMVVRTRSDTRRLSIRRIHLSTTRNEVSPTT
jgi:hypothetical protein